MKAIEYLELVARTVANHGHRGNEEFQKAASWAGINIHHSSPVAVSIAAKECCEYIKEGLKTYVPGAQWFDATSAVEYATLVAKYNSVTK